MTHPLTPREKVARIVDPAAFLFTTDELMKGDTSQYDALRKADAILTALASGSGDHAELARLAESATPGPWKACGSIYEHMNCEVRGGAKGEGQAIAQVWDGPNAFKDGQFIAAANPATVLALLAEIAALRSANTEAERKLAEAVGVVEWYGENARLARLIHSEGDAGRNALADDGGKRARTFLSKEAERG